MGSGIQIIALVFFLIPIIGNHLYADDLFSSDLLTNYPVKTVKANKRDGDPINIALVGSKAEIIDSMIKAGWSEADPLTVRTLSHEVESVIVKKQYACAPVSALYLFGRKQDLAFEQVVGHSPRQRHHVRFWRSTDNRINNREVWFGAATFDTKVGLSKFNHEITHHIDPDIDLERNKIVTNLSGVGKVKEIYNMEGIGLTIIARNGEGDPYFTDGEITVVLLAEENNIVSTAPVTFSNPKSTKAKKYFWGVIKKGLVKVFKKRQIIQ